MKLSEIFQFVEEKYGVKLQLVKKYDDGFRNDVFKVKGEGSEKFFVLIVYKKEEGIEKIIQNAHDTAQFLQTKNFPARVPLVSKDKNFYESFSGRFLGLYPLLDGETIPWEAYKRRHLKSIGKTLSDIHFEFQNFDQKNLPLWKDEILREINFMGKYFKKVEPWINKKLNLALDWEKINTVLETSLEIKQKNIALHYDFVRGNILFSDKILKDDTYEITGMIDFEKVCIGPAIVDITRTLSFLIIDCKFKNEEEVKKWFLLRGYLKRGKFKVKINKFLLEKLLKIFWFRDFYKFLLHNPYEYLNQNEHYTRTAAKLLERGILTELK